MRFRKDLGDLTDLKNSIKEIGQLHPIVKDSNGNLIAGERRKKACEELGIEPIYRIINLNNPEKAEIDENTQRKDFNPSEIFEINKYYNEKLSQAGKRNDINLGVNDTKVKKQPRNVVSDITGVGTKTLSKINKIYNSGNESIKKKVDEKEISIDKGYNELKKSKRAQEIELIKEKIRNENFCITGDTKYDVLVIDPPWMYGGQYDPENRRVTSPYPEMSTEEIAKIQLPIKDNAVVFLWTTHRFIKDAFQLIEIWGLEYKCIVTWNKIAMGIGTFMRKQCEFCLIATKGKPLTNGTNIRDIITEQRREHSRKPEAFYKLVKDFTTGNKLDYFSREKREGWDTLGIENNKFKNN